jgi:hypothetical protein
MQLIMLLYSSVRARAGLKGASDVTTWLSIFSNLCNLCEISPKPQHDLSSLFPNDNASQDGRIIKDCFSRSFDSILGVAVSLCS